jgi:hypothetical protein
MLMVAVAWHMYDITFSAWDLGFAGLWGVSEFLCLRRCGRKSYLLTQDWDNNQPQLVG